MSSRALNVDRLDRFDVAAFAESAGEIAGRWPLSQLPRLASAAVQVSADQAVDWTLCGERRVRAGGQPEVWLHATAHAALALQCQRCLEPIEQSLDVSTSFQFVADENEAAELDLDSEHDVLALAPAINVAELLEDELLLALPVVPRHETCAVPVTAQADTGNGPETEHPFAALAALKLPGRRR